MQRDQRLGVAGRARQVAALADELLAWCGPLWFAELPPPERPAEDYRLLVHELMRLALAQQLFTFVTAPPVEQPKGACKAIDGTNNEAERTLGNVAQARPAGRTNKSHNGTRRQTILTRVLESLRL